MFRHVRMSGRTPAPTKEGRAQVPLAGIRSGPVEVSQRIAGARDVLTKAERRVAEVVLQRPQAVAFGTVAELASQSGSGAATVVRLAVKLGYDGFTGLQDAVQAELEGRLRPAVERIRQPVRHDVIEAALTRELGNVHETLESLDRAIFDVCAARCSPTGGARCSWSHRRRDQGSGRPSGHHARRPPLPGRGVDGQPGCGRGAARRRCGPATSAVAIDLRRYEAWAVRRRPVGRRRGAEIVAVTDSRLSPLAALGERCFVVAAEGAGPFDSHVGTLALLNAPRRRGRRTAPGQAAARLDAIEAAWRDAGGAAGRARGLTES